MISKIFTFKEIDMGSDVQLIYYDVEFIVDFGIFKKGEKCKSISMVYEAGHMIQFDGDGKFLKIQLCQLTPK